MYAYSKDADNNPIRLMVSRCDGSRYVDPQPLALSFNTESNYTLGPVADLSRPGELLISGIAPSPKAGKVNIYRTRAPELHGLSGCLR